MKNMTRKFLAAGLIATALTFVGCKSNTSAEQGTTPDQGTTTTPAEGTGTGTDTGTGTTPGTGGGGTGTEDVSKTKSSDDNLWQPEDDPYRTPERESIEDAAREDERGAHDNKPGTGGAGFPTEPTDDNLDQGGNADDTTLPPMDPTPDDNMINESQIPEGTR
jgi:hypothetical protein